MDFGNIWGKKKKEREKSPSFPPALVIPHAVPGWYGVQLSPFKIKV